VRPALSAPVLSSLVLVCASLATALQPADADGPPTDASLVESASAWWTGSFSTEGQNGARPADFHHLVMHAEPIWTDRDDGPWLYVEQALASTPDRPYLQQVQRFTTTDSPGVIACEIYSIPDVRRFVGAWEKPARFDELDPDELTRREGCTLRFAMTHPRGISPHVPAFYGATSGRGCRSELRGAYNATTEVRLFADGIHIWERGFDLDGQQVWGPTAGPYEFMRVER